MTEINALPAAPAPTGQDRHERPAPAREAVMRHAAREFEAVFLAEMLKHAGLGRMRDGLNGGPGEAAFTGMLTQEYAKEITRSRSLGLAEKVLDAMRRIEP